MAKRVISSLPELLAHIRYRDGRMKAAVADASVAGVKHVVKVMAKTTAFQNDTGRLREAIEGALISVKATELEIVVSLSIGRKLKYTRVVQSRTHFTAEGLSRYGTAFLAAANGRLDKLSAELG